MPSSKSTQFKIPKAARTPLTLIISSYATWKRQDETPHDLADPMSAPLPLPGNSKLWGWKVVTTQ